MKKRILSAFLALTMAVTLLPAASAAATQEEMLQAQRTYINPNSTRDLCDFAERLL